MKQKKATIFIYLMNTEMELWRPVMAEDMGYSVFKILSKNLNPDDEEWQFKTGEVVRCEPRTLFDCTHTGCLVAEEKIM